MRGRIVKVTTPPAEAPVSLSEMKDHLRVIGSDQDALIGKYISAAVSSIGINGELGRALGSQTISESLQRPARDTYLSVAPATSLVSVKYYDAVNVEQTADLSGFEFYSSYDWAFVRSDVWPAAYDRPDAVTIEYNAGGDVPEDICHAIKLIVAHWYEHPMDAAEDALTEIPRAASHLLGLHRVGWYG